jgi:hypothetical protein
MRVAIITSILLALTLTDSAAQTPPPALSIIISPPVAGIGVPRDLQLRNLASNLVVTAILFDPAAAQTTLELHADSSGAAAMALTPPGGSWTVGLYRVVVDTGGGASISAEFVASDGQPHLSEAEPAPSPFSALNIQGTGLPSNAPEDITVYFANQQGQRTFHETTDDNGALSLYVWPQQFGVTFFSSGTYRIVAPSLGLETDVTAREHPVSAFITVNGPVVPGAGTRVNFYSYTPNHYLWVVYSALAGTPAGETLVGPTDERGNAVASLPFSGLSSGDYLLATPYDWGEAAFSVSRPAPTSTPAVTLTPTATEAPTPSGLACFIVVNIAHRQLKAGRKQTATVTTLPGAGVSIAVQFPNRARQSSGGVAGTVGTFAWTFTQPGGVTTPKGKMARITGVATCAGQPPVRASRTYRIR